MSPLPLPSPVGRGIGTVLSSRPVQAGMIGLNAGNAVEHGAAAVQAGMNGDWVGVAENAVSGIENLAGAYNGSKNFGKPATCFVVGTPVVMAGSPIDESVTMLSTLEIPGEYPAAFEIDGAIVLFAATFVPLAIVAGRLSERKRWLVPDYDLSVALLMEGDEWDERPKVLEFGWGDTPDPTESVAAEKEELVQRH